MKPTDGRDCRVLLHDIAHRVMLERGLEPDFPHGIAVELEAIKQAASAPGGTRDLRSLAWCSIDNDDSRDLDQLSVAEALPGGATRLLVAIADVSALVRLGSAMDEHARTNTTSVYTAAQVFPMLPEKLSTNLTSLNLDSDRLANVVDMVFKADGSLQESDIYQALVRNHAKLAYNGVAAWLEDEGLIPAAIPRVAGLEENLRLQSRVTLQLRERRHENGALSFETIQARPVFAGEDLKDLTADKPNVAKNLIEDLMVAANGVAARYLAAKNFPSIRRVVRSPAHWDEIVALVAKQGTDLPGEPDASALEQFLTRAKAKDPLHFPDLSLSIIKLMGSGEYVVELPGGKGSGHFGLAVRDYAHSTAPNRRYPDLITQRLLKAAIAGKPSPYTAVELEALATHCTQQENAAKKVERQVTKSAAACLLGGRIGERFDALITGASEKGTWVRLFQPPVEGKLVSGNEGWKVGRKLRVQLVYVDVERGYIDFKSVS